MALFEAEARPTFSPKPHVLGRESRRNIEVPVMFVSPRMVAGMTSCKIFESSTNEHITFNYIHHKPEPSSIEQKSSCVSYPGISTKGSRWCGVCLPTV